MDTPEHTSASPAAHPAPAPAPRRRGLRRLPRWARVLLGIVGVLALFTTVDSIIAAVAEHRISQRIYTESNLATPPAVALAGFPYVAAAVTKELPAITVNARDVDVAGLGLVSMTRSAQYVTVDPGAVFSGAIGETTARKVFSRVQLDGVLLGRLMGLPDLQIQNRDDISPRGGWETEALMTGTPSGRRFIDHLDDPNLSAAHAGAADITPGTRPATVEVRLRIVRGTVVITPLSIIDAGSAGSAPWPEDLLRESFSLRIDGSRLPLMGPAGRVYVSGGSVYVESEEYFSPVSLAELTPRAVPLRDGDEPGL